MKKLIYAVIFVLSPLIGNAQSGRVVDESHQPISNVAVILQRLDSTFVEGVTTNMEGRFSIQSGFRPYRLLFRHLSYASKEIVTEQDEIGDIILQESSIGLESVLVRPEEMSQFATHRTYQLSQEELKRHTNFLRALNEIPQLSVDMNNKFSYMGMGGVKVLINGINSDEKELALLTPDEIARIEVYDTPPARFAAMGLGCVVNIITKKNLRGGSVGIDLQDAVHPLYGNNSLGFTYNRNNSRWTLKYDNTLRRNKHARLSEDLSYSFDGISYSKHKQGVDSPFNWDVNNIQVGYMLYNQNNYQFNVTSGVEFQERTKKNRQVVTYSDGSLYNSLNYNKNNYKKYLLDLYFSKTFNKENELLVNLTGTYYDSDATSGYVEEDNGQDGGGNFESHSVVSGKKPSLIADTRYTRTSAWGTLSLGIRNFFQYNTQKLLTDQQGEEEISALSNQLYGYGEYFGKFKNKLLYYINIGVDHSRFESKELDRSYSFLYFHPRLRLTYLPHKKVQFFTLYELQTTNPSISMLSETPIWLDNKYAYQGNSSLQPYRTHYLLVAGYYNSRKITLAMNLIYRNSPHSILPYFIEGEASVLQTYANLKRAEQYGGVGVISWYPLKSKELLFKLTGSLTRYTVNGAEFNWAQNSARFIANAQYNPYRWGVDLFYQTSTKIITGQLLRKLPAAAYAEVHYKPLSGMAVGLGWRYPFFNTYKEGTQTHPSAIVRSVATESTKDYANMVYCKFSYNFSFGRGGTRVERKLNNRDTDAGILSR